jgi:hypothetical protein
MFVYSLESYLYTVKLLMTYLNRSVVENILFLFLNFVDVKTHCLHDPPILDD